MKRLLVVFGLVVILLLASVSSGFAITDGELDGENHPHVVLLVMDVGGSPAYRCSATMLTETVVLTAGHCTSNYPGEPYSGMRIFTESDVQYGTNNYPFAGPNSIEAAS
ncbi:MAG: trypsin-like serine protease, partial [Anaerolineales bacterium]|nr:trypsin-like serine protease [Anaerolineales bacterium]